MKILHLVHGRSATGPAAAALSDVRALAAAGHRAWLAGRAGTRLEDDARAAGADYLGGFALGRGAARILRLPADARRLRALAGEHGIEVVHVHRTDDQFLARFALKKELGARIVRTWHRDPAEVPAPLRGKLLERCAAFCCVARAHAEALRGFGAPRAAYLPPGVDTSLFRPRAERGAGPPRLGLLGRWKRGEDRGQRAFLEVLARLDARLEWRGVLLGRGEDRPALEALRARHPFKDGIELEETGADFPAQVARLDLGLVFATGSDGTSRAAVELLACGVPLLLAGKPGLKELGEDEACASVLPPEDLDAWAAAVTLELRAPARRAERARAARERALAVHALARRGEALVRLYEAED
ncbi:MAG: glycosyltransferase [Planctomycetota bacterium]|nr:glycosyltransferase [Planctomycetota bacterium]